MNTIFRGGVNVLVEIDAVAGELGSRLNGRAVQACARERIFRRCGACGLRARAGDTDAYAPSHTLPPDSTTTVISSTMRSRMYVRRSTTKFRNSRMRFAEKRDAM